MNCAGSMKNFLGLSITMDATGSVRYVSDDGSNQAIVSPLFKNRDTSSPSSPIKTSPPYGITVNLFSAALEKCRSRSRLIPGS
jgi:hypothetical protein